MLLRAAREGDDGRLAEAYRRPYETLVLDTALERPGQLDPDKKTLIELRFYARDIRTVGCPRGGSSGSIRCWETSKTPCIARYRAIKGKYQQRNLCESCYRFNRRFDLAGLVVQLIHSATRTPPMPYSLVTLDA